MFQFLRNERSRWISQLILSLMAVPFLFVGVNSYFDAKVPTWVAKVGDVEISQADFRARFEDYRQQMRRQLGERYDGRELEQLAVKRRVLERMIDEELMRQAGSRLGVVVSAQQLQKEISSIPAFQSEGRFDPAQYRMLLSMQRMTPKSFEEQVRRDLQVRALPLAITDSALATTLDVDRYLQLRDQRRDLRFVELPAPAAGAVEPPSDEQLKAYYETHADRYRTEETVTLEYVEIDASKLDVPATADEETLRQRYEEQKNRFVSAEQRLASHILVKVAEDAPADVQQQAQAKAQKLAEEARAPGADFAALARDNSEDPGSRASGGDLGWLEAGVTDPAFDSALFALGAGEISAPVKSSEGWHVIQLREIRPGTAKPFEEVRAQLEKEYLDGERERVHSELAGRLVDIVYRDPTTLNAAAQELNLEIKRIGPFGRTGGADPLSSHPELLRAAFSPQVLEQGNASDPIDVGEGRTVVIKLAEHVRPKQIPLEEIREQVAQEWTREQRQALAKAQAQSLFDRLRAGEPLDQLAKEAGGEVKEEKGVGRAGMTVDPRLSEEAFALPHPQGDKPSSAMVELGGERYALLQVLAVQDGDPSGMEAEARSALRGQLAQVIGVAESDAFLSALRDSTQIAIAEERL